MPVNTLRRLSPRPRLIVDSHDWWLLDPDGNAIGMSGPLGRARVVFALTSGINRHAWWMRRPWFAVVDHHGNLVADPADTLLGRDVVWVSRMLTALPVHDTRRIA